jgi:molybdate-binding protein
VFHPSGDKFPPHPVWARDEEAEDAAAEKVEAEVADVGIGSLVVEEVGTVA